MEWLQTLGLDSKLVALIGAGLVLAFSAPIQKWPELLRDWLGQVGAKTGIPQSITDRVAEAADQSADIVAYLQLRDKLIACRVDAVVWQAIAPGQPLPAVPQPAPQPAPLPVNITPQA